MHDPLVLVRSIRRPSPLALWRCIREPKRRWRHGSRLHRWWRNSSTGLLDVWHREPGGRDSGEVCKHHARHQDENGKWHTTFKSGWKWHVHHWHLRFWPTFHLRRWLYTRCAECGRRFSWGYAPVSHGWNGGPPPWLPWRRKEPRSYHRECSGLASLRNAQREHELIHYRALAALALEWDVPIEDVPRRLFAGTDGYRHDRESGGAIVGDFNLRYRLDKLIEKGEPSRTLVQGSHA